MQESSHNSTYAEITQALEALLEPGSVCEIRIPKSKRGTRSGYFNNFETLANQVASLSGSAPGIYITINPVRGELLSRAINRWRTMPNTVPQTGTLFGAAGCRLTSILYDRQEFLP